MASWRSWRIYHQFVIEETRRLQDEADEFVFPTIATLTDELRGQELATVLHFLTFEKFLEPVQFVSLFPKPLEGKREHHSIANLQCVCSHQSRVQCEQTYAVRLQPHLLVQLGRLNSTNETVKMNRQPMTGDYYEDGKESYRPVVRLIGLKISPMISPSFWSNITKMDHCGLGQGLVQLDLAVKNIINNPNTPPQFDQFSSSNTYNPTVL